MKSKLIQLFCLVALSVTTVGVVSCGSSGNVFEKAQTISDKEKARKLMAKGDFAGAVVLLERYLQSHPDDKEAKSALVYAQSKLLDCDPAKILSKIADPSAAGSDWQKLSQAMPAGTQENVDKLKSSVDLLNSIPADERSPEQNYQLAMANATLAVVQAKMVATDENGNFDSAKAQTELDDTKAQTIIDSVNGANSALAASGSDSSNSNKLGTVSSDLNNSEGASSSEKLKNFLQKK